MPPLPLLTHKRHSTSRLPRSRRPSGWSLAHGFPSCATETTVNTTSDTTAFIRPAPLDCGLSGVRLLSGWLAGLFLERDIRQVHALLQEITLSGVKRIKCGRFFWADRHAASVRGGAPRSNLNSVWLHGPLKAACSSFWLFVAFCRSNMSRMRAFCGDKSFPITAPASSRVLPPPSQP